MKNVYNNKYYKFKTSLERTSLC